MGVVVNARPWPPCSLETLGTHLVGRWIGSSAGLDRCGNYSPLSVFDPLTVQHVASCYTHYAILAPQNEP